MRVLAFLMKSYTTVECGFQLLPQKLSGVLPDAKRGLMTLAKMKYELEDLLGREVDLVSKYAIETSHNWIRRAEILGTAQVVYVAR